MDYSVYHSRGQVFGLLMNCDDEKHRTVTKVDKISPIEKWHGCESDSDLCKVTGRYLDFDEHTTLSEDDVEIIMSQMGNRSISEAREIIEKALVEHNGDPCMSKDKLDMLQKLVSGPPDESDMAPWTTALLFEAFLIADWSIYPEVRSVTRPIDEYGEDYENFRVYFLGVFWACAGSAMDTFFAERYPAIKLNSGAILVLLVYSGKLWAMLPRIEIPLGRWKFELNSGRSWSFKEQMLATLTMSVSVGTPYAHKAIVAQANSYFLGLKEATSFAYIVLLITSSAFLGFGIAGIMRIFLVYPVRCVWYSVLPTIAVNRALVLPQPRPHIHGWHLRGWEFFGLFTAISFIWYWVTNFLFQALSYFDWIAWIAPTNIAAQALGGCITGLALNPVSTFDWNNIGPTAITSPVFAKTNVVIGMMLSMLALIGIWWTNISWTAYLPINATELYGNDGKPFDVLRILQTKTYDLDAAKYQSYSPAFWSAGAIVNLGANLATYTAIVVYTLLYYSGFIVRTAKVFWHALLHPAGAKMGDDRFCRAQMKYKEVPEWWFFLILGAALALAITLIEVFRFTSTPIWTIFLGMGLACIFSVPFGYLYATTTISFEIGTIYELILGYLLPGNLNGMIVSKVFANHFFKQTEDYVTNQAQGHYTGIAPRALFRCQMVSVACASLVQSAIVWWQVLGGIPDMCNPQHPEKYTCQHTRTYFNQTIQWGALGPRRLLDGMYPIVKWCFLAGALYPLPLWLLRKYYSHWRWLHYTHELALLGAVSWAPQNLMYVVPAWYVNIAVNWFVKKKWPLWWTTYAYLFCNALEVGVGFGGLIMFFTTQYKKRVSLDWWGNTVSYSVGDTKGVSRLEVPKDRGYFGPEKGNFP